MNATIEQHSTGIRLTVDLTIEDLTRAIIRELSIPVSAAARNTFVAAERYMAAQAPQQPEPLSTSEHTDIPLPKETQDPSIGTRVTQQTGGVTTQRTNFGEMSTAN